MTYFEAIGHVPILSNPRVQAEITASSSIWRRVRVSVSIRLPSIVPHGLLSAGTSSRTEMGDDEFEPVSGQFQS